MKITMEDVAREAGVTKMTVSRVLRNSESVKQETRRKVRSAVEKLQYRIPKGASRTPALVWLIFRPENDPNCNNELLIRHLCGVDDAVLKWGCTLRILYFDDTQALKALLWRIMNPVPDGILISVAWPDNVTIRFNAQELIDALAEQNLPVVAVGSGAGHLRCHRVERNDVTGARLAVRHLLEQGHRRIAFFSREPEKHIGYQNRYAGYCAALREFALEPVAAYKQKAEGAGLLADCSGGVERLWSLPEPPSAIFTVNDSLAIELMRELKRRGILLPEQCAVCGYDNINECAQCQPPLSSVNTRIETALEQAVEMLCRIINAPMPPQMFLHLEIEPQLVIRQSSTSQQEKNG